MSNKRLEKLQELAAMVREREMAELARLTHAKQRLQAEHARVGEMAKAARLEGQESLMLAQSAETFGAWSRGRQAQIDGLIAEMQVPIDAQKARTAKAVGRHENLGKISQKLKAEEEKKAANKI
ncbi:hypothetical protein C8J27_105221 [Rhodobacter aestuarii]|uniref:Uncharacterized protein n=1 Tax=Rhodobacter aestuarii TaxID=453582 RepID=A0A1N7LFS4_9RHOB|nr:MULTISPECIES: hypothetical protein [Rhodobacter]PTV95275.1 hypothetical protein C8J27_105221 [Rhodobacter aestuarii]SIS72675.1 hypothetical protein SAMN05421580_10455 [Rhodobacter aestuarii]SOC08116.1 hypothetical protein SAMN05877809_104236 [Rhodobacter sp. JA431]